MIHPPHLQGSIVTSKPFLAGFSKGLTAYILAKTKPTTYPWFILSRRPSRHLLQTESGLAGPQNAFTISLNHIS